MKATELDARWQEFEPQILARIKADLEGVQTYGHGISGQWSIPGGDDAFECEFIEDADGQLERVEVWVDVQYTYFYQDGSGSWDTDRIRYDVFFEPDGLRVEAVEEGAVNA